MGFLVATFLMTLFLGGKKKGFFSFFFLGKVTAGSGGLDIERGETEKT